MMRVEKNTSYKEKELVAQFDAWQADFEMFQAKAKQASAQVRPAYEETLMDLRKKLTMARERLVRLEPSGEENQKDLESAIDKMWTALETAFKTAHAKFGTGY